MFTNVIAGREPYDSSPVKFPIRVIVDVFNTGPRFVETGFLNEVLQTVALSCRPFLIYD